MGLPLLQSKLFVPPTRPSLVPRPRLLDKLSEGLRSKLTLVSAPAGFGKTTLISEWVEDTGRPTAWLSLDERDSDPVRFLSYLAAGLQTIAPGVGAAMLPLLESPQTPPTDALLTELLNEISGIGAHFIVVLDDYHLIDARPIDDALTFLIEHLPPHMHLILTTREDPHLPLARLRARGDLIELRASDLRFSPAEAAEFLNRGMGLHLSAEDIGALEARTEGWIAGLQLAALSLQGHEDTQGFIRAFAGDHRYIVDYLVEEVLERQPEPVRTFLLQTAILDRLNGSLCESVTLQQGGSDQLEALERGNFFIVPLDDQRQWYRYHHLFADVLRMRLTAEQPEPIATLHRRASAWYEQHDLTADAIRHALAAEDFERASGLIERAVPTMRRSRQEATALGWLQSIPDALLRRRPVLSVHYAGMLLLNGELEGVEARLRDAERLLTAPPVERVVVDEAEFGRLPSLIAMYRAACALAVGDVPDTLNYAQQALDSTLEDDRLGRGAVAAFYGLALWTSGDLEGAHRSYVDAMARMQQAGHISDAIGCAMALADILIAQGRLREAMSVYERGLHLATQDGLMLRGAADMLVGMSEILREWGDLDGAADHLMRSQELGEFAGLPQNRYRRRVALAQLREAQGDLDGALDLLGEAERVYVSDYFPNVRPVAALRTRLWLRQGRLGEAFGWAREQRLSAEDDLSYLRLFEHITLARALLARYVSDRTERAIQEATGLLERLLRAAEAGGWSRHILETLVLQALACQMQGDLPGALAPLQRALALAEPEGFVWLFVNEGRPLISLLEEAAKQGDARQGSAPHYVRQLLSAFGKTERRSAVKPALSEPLSERELEVLRLLSTDMSGPAIARELVVSLNTLRSHTKSIYDKLGVNSRRAEVRRAEELDLL